MRAFVYNGTVRIERVEVWRKYDLVEDGKPQQRLTIVRSVAPDPRETPLVALAGVDKHRFGDFWVDEPTTAATIKALLPPDFESRLHECRSWRGIEKLLVRTIGLALTDMDGKVLLIPENAV